jgi:hypothetical protein
MKKKMLKLYWVSDGKGLEDWFVVANTAKQAEKFYVEQEFGEVEKGYVTTEEIMSISEALLVEEEYEEIPDWADLSLLKKLGFKIINQDSPMRVRYKDMIFKEGKMQGNLDRLTRHFFGEPETETFIERAPLDYRKVYVGDVLAFNGDIRETTLDDLATFHIDRMVPEEVCPVIVNSFTLMHCLSFTETEHGQVELVISDRERSNDFYYFMDRLLLVYREGGRWRDDDLAGFFLEIERVERKTDAKSNAEGDFDWQNTSSTTYRLPHIKYLHQVQQLINVVEEGYIEPVNLALLGFSYEKNSGLDELEL